MPVGHLYVFFREMSIQIFCLLLYIFLKDFIYLFLERGGREGEREEKKRQYVVVSWAPPTGDLSHNPGMCPDWESDHWPFGSQASTESTEPQADRALAHF